MIEVKSDFDTSTCRLKLRAIEDQEQLFAEMMIIVGTVIHSAFNSSSLEYKKAVLELFAKTLLVAGKEDAFWLNMDTSE